MFNLGIIGGTALCDWGRRKGHGDTLNRRAIEPEEISDLNVVAETAELRQKWARLLRNLLVDPLSIIWGSSSFSALSVFCGTC